LGFVAEAYKVEMIKMKPKILRRKHTYWHQLAKAMLEFGLKPTIIGQIVKDIFPETEVNGRHIGAYRRRLIKDGELEETIKPTVSKNEASQLGKKMVSTEDMFIYQCVVGSTKNSLKCFEFKFKAEDKDILKEIETWITTKIQ